MTKVSVGNIIKSMDFPRVDDTFIVGFVYKVENGMIYCYTTKKVVEGEIVFVNVQESFITQEQGEGLLDRIWTNRIQILL